MKPGPSSKRPKEILSGHSVLPCQLGDFEEIVTERGPVAASGDCVITEEAGSRESTTNHVLLLGGEPFEWGAGAECTPEVSVGRRVDGTCMFERFRELNLVVDKAHNRIYGVHGMQTHL